MSELRIILDKSVVFGLTNPEIDSLDLYFFLIVPPILTNEILADLAKEEEDPGIRNAIARHSYRISGNRGITVDYHTLLANSLMGNEAPMDGRYIPAGLTTVRGADGSIGSAIETKFEDDTIARWERREFTEQEAARAEAWRKRVEAPIYPKNYLDNIAKAGLEYRPPRNDEELVATVDSILNERKFQPRVFPLIARAFRIPEKGQQININRWFKEGKPMFRDFAPYAFFCLRANMLLALGLTNPNIFTPDKNDRKDLVYCYYLPHCEIFASNDRKHKRLARLLLRKDQSFVKGDVLKADLRRLAEIWEKLSREEKIRLRDERGNAPPEDESSIVFQLWKKHRGTLSKPISREILKAMVVDASKPKEEQIPITFAEMLKQLMEKTKPSAELPFEEARKVEDTSFAVRTTRIRKDRALKLYPHLTEADLEEKKKC